MDLNAAHNSHKTVASKRLIRYEKICDLPELAMPICVFPPAVTEADPSALQPAEPPATYITVTCT